jgi:predicted Zn finger-like uncharacterized protein
MVLATRCPHCETVFRVQDTQLARTRGLVRCGHCNEVFDASQNLLDPGAASAIDVGAGDDKEAAAEAGEASSLARMNGQLPAESPEEASHKPDAPHAASPEEAPHKPDAPHATSPDRLPGEAPQPLTTLPNEARSEPHSSSTASAARSPSGPWGPLVPPVAPDDDARTTDEPPFTFADIVADELSEPAPAPTHAVKPTEAPAVKPTEAPAAKPTEAPAAGSTETFAARPADAPAAKPIEAPVAGSTETFAARPADAPAAKPIEAPAAGSTETFAARPADAPAAKPTETFAATSGAKSAEAPRDLHARPAPLAPDSSERERAASDTPGRPRADRSGEPKLSLGNAPNPLWREDQEPQFRIPRASEPQMPPAREPWHGGVPPVGPDEARARPFEVTREPRAPARRRKWLLAIGGFLALILFVVLVAQLAWWRREAVMVYWPASQPVFADVCTRLGCQISPPRDIDGLQVEASDLRQVDGPHRLELRVPLRNRYDIALAYPAIELTLFDEKNEVAIRRVLWPQDYAPPGTPIAAGLPPHTAQTMIVRLDSGNAVATNFRVQIFYP